MPDQRQEPTDILPGQATPPATMQPGRDQTGLSSEKNLSPADLQALAELVYQLLCQEIRVDRERHGRFG
jgi:hypothetical protein